MRPEAPGVWQRTWFPTFPLSGTADLGTGRVITPWRVLGRGEIHTQGHHLPQDCWLSKNHLPVDCWLTKDSIITEHLHAPLLRNAGSGASIINQILHRNPFTRPPSRNRAYFCPFRELDEQGNHYSTFPFFCGLPSSEEHVHVKLATWKLPPQRGVPSKADAEQPIGMQCIQVSQFES